MNNELKLREALRWALEWIDSVPDDVQLPAMPGFDREYVNGLLERTPPAASGQQEDLSAAILRIPCAAPEDIKGKGIFVYYYENGLRDGLRKAAELVAAHPAPAQQESEPKPKECSGDPACCPENEGYGCHCSSAPAPAALTDEQIDALIASHGTGGWQTTDDMRRFARAILATASAAPAEQARDAARLQWMIDNLWREASMRFDDGSFKTVNAWTIASADKDLRAAIDAAIASQQQGGV